MYAALSAFSGDLWIDNFVSRVGRKGHGRAALRATCEAADANDCAISGAVQPHDAGGSVTAGAKITDLLRWYGSEGFRRLPVVGGVVVRRMPRNRRA